MKSHKQVQADHRKRKRDNGMVPKEVWVFPEDWKEINHILEEIIQNISTYFVEC